MRRRKAFPFGRDAPVRVEDVLDAAVDATGEVVSVSGYLLLQQLGPALLCGHPLTSRPPYAAST